MTNLLEEVSWETNPESIRAVRNMGPGLFGRVGRVLKRVVGRVGPALGRVGEAGSVTGAVAKAAIGEGPAVAGNAGRWAKLGELARGHAGSVAMIGAPIAAGLLVSSLLDQMGYSPESRALERAPLYTAPEQMLDYRLQQSQRAKMLQALQANPALMATLQKEAESQSRLAQGKGRGEIQLGGSPGGQFENPNALVDMLVNDNG